MLGARSHEVLKNRKTQNTNNNKKKTTKNFEPYSNQHSVLILSVQEKWHRFGVRLKMGKKDRKSTDICEFSFFLLVSLAFTYENSEKIEY